MTQPASPKSIPAVPAGEPIWADLTTPMPEQARDFYAALFGWEYQIAPEFGGYATAHLGGKKAAGIAPPPPQGMDSSAPPQWMIYFDTKDIVADAERVKSLGGTAFWGPVQIGNQGQAHHFTDPGGATFGLWQDDQHGGFFAEGQPVSVVWAEMNTRDSAAALAFYGSFLKATSEQIPGMDYHTLHHGGEGFAGVSGFAQNWEAVNAGGWMVYFYAPDVDETARKAAQHGGKILAEPWDTPYGRMAVLADPAGAVFSVMTPQPGQPATTPGAAS